MPDNLMKQLGPVVQDEQLRYVAFDGAPPDRTCRDALLRLDMEAWRKGSAYYYRLVLYLPDRIVGDSVAYFSLAADAKNYRMRQNVPADVWRLEMCPWEWLRGLKGECEGYVRGYGDEPAVPTPPAVLPPETTPAPTPIPKIWDVISAWERLGESLDRAGKTCVFMTDSDAAWRAALRSLRTNCTDALQCLDVLESCRGPADPQ
jgi:hypothetical protein